MADRIKCSDDVHRLAKNATGFAIYNHENVDSVFLSPMKVKSSSSSASFTSFGTGALGIASATSITQ